MTALVATANFARNKLVDFKCYSIFLPGTIVVSLLGALFSSRVPMNLLLGIFIRLPRLCGAIMIFTGKGEETRVSREPIEGMAGDHGRQPFFVGVGVLSRLIGVGGGLIIFPFLVLYLGYNPRRRLATNAYIVIFAPSCGSLGHMAVGQLNYLLSLVTAVAVAIGSAHRVST